MTVSEQGQTEAARWILKREQSDWTEEHEAELQAWLDSSPANKVAFWRLEHGWESVSRLASLRQGVSPYVPRYERPKFAAALAAAIVGVVCFSTFRIFWTDDLAKPPAASAVAKYSTITGSRKTLALQDGSKVELNTDTEVGAGLDTSKREFWLVRGEAFFQVAHAPDRPFVVHAGTKRIVVLGTKFSVRAEGNKITVGVLEGRVRIYSSTSSGEVRSTTIAAGDVAVSDGPSTLVLADSEERVQEGLSWRSGMLTFDQATLAEVAHEFNRYNKRKLVISDARVAKIRMGGTFQWSNLDAFARLMQDAYGLKVEARGESIELSSEDKD